MPRHTFHPDKTRELRHRADGSDRSLADVLPDEDWPPGHSSLAPTRPQPTEPKPEGKPPSQARTPQRISRGRSASSAARRRKDREADLKRRFGDRYVPYEQRRQRTRPQGFVARCENTQKAAG